MSGYSLSALLRLAMLSLPIAGVAVLASTPAHAQFSDSYTFLKAVRDRDGEEATRLLSDQSSRLVNTRDVGNGETALIIVAKRRDLVWLRFLAARGADVNLADRQGMTPLMHATLLGFAEGATELLERGAVVDQANRRGETALIMAVQRRDPALVRLLVRRGANPDRSDHVAGLTARDYARRDDRTGTILALLDSKEPAPDRDVAPILGPAGR